MRREIVELVERGEDAAMHAVVELARADALEDRDVADLARGLADSGARLTPDANAADLASTGGPSSLSTLLCPLYLRARGLAVPKLGVRGRPAGGVDVLETIPGFRPALDREAAVAALTRSRYIHLLADERWAPLDARLFAYRQREGGQNVAALVIASILAKKLAAGVTGVGLEVRVAPHGNFGSDFAHARRNADRYNRVAVRLGLRPVCVLTDGSRPYQPHIGRGEALAALAAVLNGEPCTWLAEHHQLCRRMSDTVASILGIDISEPVETAKLRGAHEEMLAAQGAAPSAFWDRAEAIRTAPRTTVSAERPGWVDYDLGILRTLLVERQVAGSDPRSPSDPAGVTLLVRPGDHVETGQPVMAARAVDGAGFADRVRNCLRISPTELRRPIVGACEIVAPGESSRPLEGDFLSATRHV